MKRSISLLCLSFVLFPLLAFAQARPYTEGPVTQVVGIKIKAGNFDKYMAYLASTWKKEQEALKAAGIITEYAVFTATAGGPQDADVYLTTTYENMAALDGLDDRSDPVLAKALGTTREEDMQGMADRNAYREVLGIEIIRELKLK